MDKEKITRKEVIEQLKGLIELFSKPFAATCKIKKPKKEDSLQEIINYLRVGIKYMLLDREAYKREIGYLKKLLEDNNKRKK